MHTQETDVPLANAVSLNSFLSGSITPPSPAAYPSGAVKATLHALYSGSPGAPGSFSLTEQLILVPDLRAIPHGASAPDLDSLTLRANAAAASVACGSLLAGHTSESDEFGDVGFALGEGPYGPGSAQAILRALGLADAAAQGEIESVHLEAATRLPGAAVPSGGTLTAEVRAVSEIVSVLEDLHCFRVGFVGRPRDGNLVLYVLIGRAGTSWSGLLGLGVWSDE